MGGLVTNLHGRTPWADTSWPSDSLTRFPGWAELEAPEREFRIPGSREGSYTRMSKWKSLFDYLNPAYLCVWRSVDFSRQMYRFLWVKCTPLQRFSNYSNSRVLGHGRLASCAWLLSIMKTTYGELDEWHEFELTWLDHDFCTLEVPL
jgi:hypothetical protein